MKCEIWRYDGLTWEEIAKKGFGRANIIALSAAVLNNSLYFGTGTKLGGEIWKTSDGKNWTNIINHGFGKITNIAMWRIHIYKDKLIIGTFNPLLGCQIWASTNNNPDKKSDFKKVNINGMDGEKIGLLLPQQYGARTFENFQNQLYVGTNSWIAKIQKDGFVPGDGCEVWRIEHLSIDLGESH